MPEWSIYIPLVPCSAFRACTACPVAFSIKRKRKGQGRGYPAKTCLELLEGEPSNSSCFSPTPTGFQCGSVSSWIHISLPTIQIPTGGTAPQSHFLWIMRIKPSWAGAEKSLHSPSHQKHSPGNKHRIWFEKHSSSEVIDRWGNSDNIKCWASLPKRSST